MKIIHLQTGVCALILAALGTAVNASNVSLSAPASVAPGAFQIQVFGDFDDVGGLGAGGFDVIYDDSLFSITTFTHALVVDPSLSCPGNVGGCPPIDGVSPDLVAFGSFGGLIAAGAGNTLIGTLEMTALAAGTGSFTLVDNPSFTGSWLDFGINPAASPTYTGATVEVTAVPVPAAVWLFGSGLLGLVGVARRRKAA